MLTGGSWETAPRLVVGAGFPVFAAAWRSVSTAVFAGVELLRADRARAL